MHLSIVNLSLLGQRKQCLPCQEELMYEMKDFICRGIHWCGFKYKNLSFHLCLYIYQVVCICVCERCYIPIFSVSLVNVYCRILLSNTSLGSIVIYLLPLLKELPTHKWNNWLYLQAKYFFIDYILFLSQSFEVCKAGGDIPFSLLS